MNRVVTGVVSLCAALIVFSTALHADLIVQPNIVSASFAGNGSYLIGNLTNQRGFRRPGFPTAYISGVSDFTSFTAATWHSTNTQTGFSGNRDNWVSAQNQSFPGHIDFDLGSMWDLNGVAVWNSRGTLSVDGVTFFASPDATFTTLTPLGSFNLTMVSTGIAYVQSDNFSLPTTSTQYVRMQIDSTHDTVGRAAMGEVAFSVVPEPTAGPMMFALFVGIATMRRKRR